MSPPEQEELRGLRRWLIVAGAWAVAASAIALIALFTGRQDSEKEARSAAQEQVGELRQRLDARVKSLSDQVEQHSQVLGRLSGEVQEAGSDATEAKRTADRARGSVSSLRDEVEQLSSTVDDLEANQGSGGGSSSDSTP